MSRPIFHSSLLSGLDLDLDLRNLTAMTGDEMLDMFVNSLDKDDQQFIDLLLHSKQRNLRFPLDINKVMIVVASKGNTYILRKLLTTLNPLINTVDEKGRRPIHYAAMNGHLECVRLLIRAGSVVNCADKEGKMPLHLACLMDQADVVHLLLKNCAHVNSCRNEAGESAVHMTASAGQLTVMTILLENGGDPNATSASIDGEQTPIHKAVAADKPEMVQLLISYGGNPNTPNASQELPIHLSSELGHMECTKVLIKAGALLEEKDSKGQTALCSAVVGGHSDVSRLLLCHGANVHVEDAHYHSLLHIAALKDNAELIELLVNAGLDVDIQERKLLRSPLMLGVYMGSLTAVEKLLELRADANLADKRQCTPLHLVHCHYGKCSTKDLVEVLLKAGAYLDVRDLGEQTPLQRCLGTLVLRGKPDIDSIKLLCEAGSHLAPDQTKNIHQSPLFRLAYMGFLREALYLAQAGWDLSSEIWLTLPGKKVRQDRLHQMLIDIKGRVPSLLCCCRKTIRNTLLRRRRHREILSSIALLPVPYPVKKYLSLRDIQVEDDSLFDAQRPEELPPLEI